MYSLFCDVCVCAVMVFFFQAEDGIRDSVASRGLGDVYKRQLLYCSFPQLPLATFLTLCCGFL